MKTEFALTLLLCLAMVVPASAQISQDERAKATASLKASQKAVVKAVKGLSDAQLNYKPDSDTWSIAECLEHITISEGALTALRQETLKSNPDPNLKANLPLPDEQVVSIISDRSQKVKTRSELEPSNSFGGTDGTLAAFKKKRKASIKYIKSTDDDLRSHFYEFPFGKVDAYQIILFMSGHTVRHVKQIKEVKNSGGFPKTT